MVMLDDACQIGGQMAMLRDELHHAMAQNEVLTHQVQSHPDLLREEEARQKADCEARLEALRQVTVPKDEFVLVSER